MKPSPPQIALAAAAVFGIGLGGYGIGRLVGGGGETVTVKSLVTAMPTTATVERTTTTTKTRTKTVTTGGSDSGSKAYDSPTAAARPYLEDELGFGSFVDETVTYSDKDPDFALVTYFDNDANPAAVWVVKADDGWKAVAGTLTPGEPAPGGLGIPDDISLPFSD